MSYQQKPFTASIDSYLEDHENHLTLNGGSDRITPIEKHHEAMVMNGRLTTYQMG